MLKRVMKHEWRLLTADATAWVVIGLFAVAVGCGIYSGARWVSFQKQAIRNLAAEESERLNGILAQARAAESNAIPASVAAEQWDPRHPYFLGGQKGSRYAFLPPTQMAVTAVGQSDLYPQYFKVTTDLKQNFANNYELENPLKLLVGRFDLAFVLLYLYPLLILALSFNLVAGERENGTLGMLLSQPVRLRTIVLGKAAIRALIAFLSVIVFAAVGLLVAGVQLWQPDSLSRFAFWMLAVIVYGAFWFALAVLVNARGKSAANNAMALATAWLLFVVLLPSAINVVATSLYPVPSRVEYIQAMRETSQGEVAERSKLMAAFYEDHPELAKGSAVPRREEFALTREMLNKRMEERLRPLAIRFDSQLASQQSFVNLFRFLSPAILMQQALYDVAGTGTARYRHFMATVDEHHRAWKQYFNPRTARRQLVSTAEFDQIPRYRYWEESAGEVSRRLIAPLMALLAAAIIFGWTGIRSYRNHRILQ